MTFASLMLTLVFVASLVVFVGLYYWAWRRNDFPRCDQCGNLVTVEYTKSGCYAACRCGWCAYYGPIH